jgi:large subunit ribosomal protein L22
MSISKMKNISISPQKARIMARQVKGLNIQRALDILNFSKKKSSFFIKKLLNSAISNAENNEGKDIDELIITNIMVNEAPRLKRIKARAKGKANRITKRNSHLLIELKTNTELMEINKKNNKTKEEGNNGSKS